MVLEKKLFFKIKQLSCLILEAFYVRYNTIVLFGHFSLSNKAFDACGFMYPPQYFAQEFGYFEVVSCGAEGFSNLSCRDKLNYEKYFQFVA